MIAATAIFAKLGRLWRALPWIAAGFGIVAALWLWNANERTKSALSAATARAAACEARVANINEDKESDRAIDDLGRDALRDHLGEWLLAPAAAP